MKIKSHFFVRNSDLVALADRLRELDASIDWLFVTLDSYRGSFDKISAAISDQLRANHISHQWSRSGLWLPNSELIKPFVQTKIIVPFSSGYIFFEKPADLATPSFNKTTDSGKEFSDGDLAACFAEISRIGAAGYAADGAGLQCLFVDDRLGRTTVAVTGDGSAGDQ
jgi:hypothetical protein